MSFDRLEEDIVFEFSIAGSNYDKLDLAMKLLHCLEDRLSFIDRKLQDNGQMGTWIPSEQLSALRAKLDIWRSNMMEKEAKQLPTPSKDDDYDLMTGIHF